MSLTIRKGPESHGLTVAWLARKAVASLAKNQLARENRV